jgi:ATP-dependent helicase/DNAse subunit B
MSKDMFTYDWNVVDYSANEEDWLEKPILKMTKSSVMSYEWCPKKYFYSYPLRLPQDRTDAMLKGTVIHDAYENFFHKFDVEKAEQLDKSELTSYAMGLFPIDEWGGDQYWTSAQFEAKRFLDCKDNGTLDDFLPVGNEVKLDALFMIARNQNPKFPLQRDYYVHLQGIIDRLFVDEGGLIPMD